MITRDISDELTRSAAEYPVVTILGPRQSGKTTLSRMTFPDTPYVSLEDPDIRAAAEADPRGFLGRMEGGCILDEVQRLPSLLSYVQGMVDKDERRGRFRGAKSMGRKRQNGLAVNGALPEPSGNALPSHSQ